MKAKITAKRENVIGEIDKRLYGSFVEHLGRAVYGGVYDPTHKNSDEDGFRSDVINLVSELNVPIVRYPGGNFVSGYNWEDGIGDKSKRPKKMELAWLSVETNQFGTDEFYKWSKKAGTDIMMAVNLGTRGADEARNLIEYCNASTDTYYANLRRQNGFEEPFNVKTWCLGNEMDGWWQICHKTAEEYGRAATEAAKVMKWVDPSIELVACGSSDSHMPTFGEWERTVLDHTYDYVDFLSLHHYFGHTSGTTENYLARAEEMDKFIKLTASICDEVKEKKGSDKTIYLSFDEYNIWFRTKDEEKTAPRWQIAPHLLEEKYNFEDALVLGGLLMALQNNADRVKMACLAQLVNVIAPVMTEDGGKSWAQTIYYPFMYASNYGRGKALASQIDAPTYRTSEGWDVHYLYASVIDNCEKNEVVVFAENRSLDSEIELDVSLDSFDGYKICEHIEFYADDLNTENDKENQRVLPKSRDISGKITLKKHSWNMLRYKKV